METLTRMQWRQGQHVIVLGQNGSGKSNLACQLAKIPTHTVAVVTKPRDPTLEALKWPKSKTFPPKYAWPHYSLWPTYEDSRDRETQKREIGKFLLRVFTIKGTCVYIDEIRYVSKRLGLEPYIIDLYTQGRSLGDTMIATAQRPRYLPLEALTESRHAFLFDVADRQDALRFADLGPSHRIMQARDELNAALHECIYVGQAGIWITQAPAIERR